MEFIPNNAPCFLFLLLLLITPLQANSRYKCSAKIGNSDNRSSYFGRLKDNENHLNSAIKNILRVRTPESAGHAFVRNYIKAELQGLSWDVEEDSFSYVTDNNGTVNFVNIVATLDPNAENRLVLACHYDSKIEPAGFLGAIDSAIPCAQMINLAHTLHLDLQRHSERNKDITLQLVFFDGEEALHEWTETDSLYGSRHMAEKLEKTPYYGSKTQLDRIELFILLDLIGAENPTFYDSQPSGSDCYAKFVELDKIHEQDRNALMFSRNVLGDNMIGDDHVPFKQRGVRIVHLIPVPFPKVWHDISDDGTTIDKHSVMKLNRIFRHFVADYLGLE